MTDTWKIALRHMRSALDALDKADAPPHIGAQLELTICRLEEAIVKQTAIEQADVKK